MAEQDMDFPECQYVANGVSLPVAKQLGDDYRVGNQIKPIGDKVADRISNRLNKTQKQKRSES
jgi:hypothetical protein